MGTNYYVEAKEPCKECGRPHEEIHIGKSSAGWCFSLHVIPELNIHNLDDWKQFWKGKTIKDEYGNTITKKKMFNTITNREWNCNDQKIPYGYTSWESFHEVNGSIPGPNGLLRHKIGRHCAGHGNGTYDYIEGEFS